jgi:hypothetical protein
LPEFARFIGGFPKERNRNLLSCGNPELTMQRPFLVFSQGVLNPPFGAPSHGLALLFDGVYLLAEHCKLMLDGFGAVLLMFAVASATFPM